MVKKRIRHRHSVSSADNHHSGNKLIKVISIPLILLIITVWSYWSTIVVLFKDWQGSDDYSAGQLVPMIALIFIWRERKKLKDSVLRPCWWGILIIFFAQAARTYGLLFMFESAERYSLILTLAGLVLMVAGRQVFRSVIWIILFLFLMVPFPGRVHNLISGPLQTMATSGSMFLLEIFIPRVSQQGNVIMLNENTPMAVAEACSGLRMLTAFIIIAAFVAYMVNRSRKHKAILFLSSVPVALMCNIIRLCVTAVLFLIASNEVAEKFFHDFAGLVMMPAAVMLMFGELWLLDKIIIPDPDPQNGQVAVRNKPVLKSSMEKSKSKKQHIHEHVVDPVK